MKSATNNTLEKEFSAIRMVQLLFVGAIFLFCTVNVTGQTHIFSPEEHQLNEDYAFADIEAIRTFVRKVLDEPLSSNYLIPSYIKESKDADEASKVVGAYYPEFYGKQGMNLLEAVKAHPAIYVRMIKEYKGIRAIFEPTN